MKKLLSLILAFVVACICIPSTSFAKGEEPSRSEKDVEMNNNYHNNPDVYKPKLSDGKKDGYKYYMDREFKYDEKTDEYFEVDTGMPFYKLDTLWYATVDTVVPYNPLYTEDQIDATLDYIHGELSYSEYLDVIDKKKTYAEVTHKDSDETEDSKKPSDEKEDSNKSSDPSVYGVVKGNTLVLESTLEGDIFYRKGDGDLVKSTGSIKLNPDESCDYYIYIDDGDGKRFLNKISVVGRTSIILPKNVYKGSKFRINIVNADKIKSIRWSSDNQKIARVSKHGVVKAIKPGKTQIRCSMKLSDKEYRFCVRINVPKQKGKTVSESKIGYKGSEPTLCMRKVVKKGKTVKISFTKKIDKKNFKLKIVNSKGKPIKSSTVRVFKDGRIRGMQKGVAFVKASFKNGKVVESYVLKCIVR